jgi:hypothetical protein
MDPSLESIVEFLKHSPASRDAKKQARAQTFGSCDDAPS